MEGARRRFLGNGNYQQGTAIIIKMFWWRNANLCEWNVNERKLVRKRTGLGNSNYQQGTAIKKNILEGNANLFEWNVTAKLMSTYKNR